MGSGVEEDARGAIGDAGTFSFQESKNISAGEGGILVTNDRHLFDLAWRIHDCGRPPDGSSFEHELPGRNLRMTEWQAAILLAQLERFPEAMRTRTRNAARLTAGLTEISGLAPMKVDDRITGHGWHLYQMRFDPAAFGGRNRADFLTALRAEGIPCGPGYVPLPYQKAIRNALRSRFGEGAVAGLPHVPRAAEAGEHTVLFVQTMLLGTDEDMDEIVAACRKIQRAWSS
jgi:dTDP-4-amino-4,6-dideoxygalactose transaminase